MAAADEVRIADRLIDSAGAAREVPEMMAGPGVGVVILRVGERAAVQLYDPGAGMRISHRFLEKAFVLVRRPPIFHPVRPSPPIAKEGQVGRRGGAETILAVHCGSLAVAGPVGEREG
ncbi:MAG: hypothetical protein WBR13_12805 [Allosphingosinicella sp.]